MLLIFFVLVAVVVIVVVPMSNYNGLSLVLLSIQVIGLRKE